MSLYVIGDENTLLGFSLIGVDGQVVGSVEEARASLQRILDDESVDMVLITENWSWQMREWINEIRMRSAKPLVMEIPGAEPAPKTLSLRELIESAVGIRLGVEGRS